VVYNHIVKNQKLSLVLLDVDDIRMIFKQKTVETSSYGSKLVAARVATKMIIEYRYKLRMIGTPINGPSIVCGDNQSAIISTTVPSSRLKKKHNSIAYHQIRAAVAGKVIRFVKVRTENNLADFLTKPLPRDFFFKSSIKSIVPTTTRIHKTDIKEK
jgi:hypothetical protein